MFEVYNKKTGSVYKKDIQSNDEACYIYAMQENNLEE